MYIIRDNSLETSPFAYDFLKIKYLNLITSARLTLAPKTG